MRLTDWEIGMRKKIKKEELSKKLKKQEGRRR